MIRSKAVSLPVGHLFTIEECRAQCEVVAIDMDSDGDMVHPDDDLLLGYMDAAAQMAENFLGLALQPRIYEAALDSFPCMKDPITLPDAPFIDILSLTYGSTSSDANALDVGIDFTVDDFDQFAKLIPVADWPSRATNIRITYVAGYMQDSDSQGVPFVIRQAIMLTLGDWYLRREDTVESQPYSLPNGAESLLRPLRVRLGMA